MGWSSRCAYRSFGGGWLLVCLLTSGGCVRLNPVYSNAESAEGTGELSTTAGLSTTTTGDGSSSSTSDLVSTSGSTGSSGSVGGSSTTRGGPVCIDDAREDDDDPEQALERGPAPSGVNDGVLCPADEDWWFVPLAEAGVIYGQLSGLDGDVQLALLDGVGEVLAASPGDVSVAEVYSGCLPPGEYFLHGSAAPMDASVDYTFELSVGPCGSCCESPGPGCLDPVIEACVCAEDQTCCTVTWDSVCENLAVRSCGEVCEP